MADNWEFASQYARGQYVGVLIDKTVLMPSALQVVSELASGNQPEIVSWWNDNYYPTNEAAGYDVGTYIPAYRPCQPEQFDPAAELRRRFRMDVRRGQEGKHYFWGKICFGVYHRDLIARIKSRIGRLFFPLSPDYTSMLAALGVAKSAFDLGRPLLMSFVSQLSNGATAARDPAFAKNFYMQIDPGVIGRLPLPGLYASNHNGVAYDYVQIQQKLGEQLGSLQLNRDNLILRAMEDLEQQQWTEESERLEQEAILAAHLNTIGTGVLARYKLDRLAQEASRFQHSVQFFPTVRRLFRPLGRRYPKFKKFTKTLLLEQNQHAWKPQNRYAWEHRRHFSSIVEAAEAADSHYNRELAGVASARAYSRDGAGS